MRTLEYLSPTSIDDWSKGIEEFYLQRLAMHRPERWPQDQAMAAGSVFDAYVKSHLHGIIFGPGSDPKYELTALIETQVEKQNWDWAKEQGPQIFEQYRNSGALADLLIDLKRAQGAISFESEIRGKVGGVSFLGKPDCYFINQAGYPVILDWKVNGWCGSGNTSPKKGYVRCRTCLPGGNASERHKDCIPIDKHGVQINGVHTIEQIEPKWAAQLSIYGWLYGAPVGSEFICAIDQIACHGGKGGPWPVCRVAEHRLLASPKYQRDLLTRAQTIWQCLTSGHIFTDLSREDSDAKCALLEGRAEVYKNDPTFAAMCRPKNHY